MIGTLIWALVVGVVLGYLGKLLLPGKQNIPAWATIGAGFVAALVAGVLARWFGWDRTAGIDWLKHGLQVLLAVLAIYLVTRLMGGGQHGAGAGGRSARPTY